MMSAPRLALISLLLLTTSVAAEPLKLTEENGSPALEGQGTSSTTISVVGGTASVTVEGSGSLEVHTHSGTVTGDGAVGVPELGIESGGGLETGSLLGNASSGGEGDKGDKGDKGDNESEQSTSSNTDSSAADVGSTDGRGPVAPGSDSGNGSAGSGNGVAQPGDRTTESSSDFAAGAPTATPETCAAELALNNATMLSLALVRETDKISIVEICDAAQRLPSRLLGAVEKNDVLVNALNAAGYSPSSIVAVDTKARGSAVVFVAAN